MLHMQDLALHLLCQGCLLGGKTGGKGGQGERGQREERGDREEGEERSPQGVQGLTCLLNRLRAVASWCFFGGWGLICSQALMLHVAESLAIKVFPSIFIFHVGTAMCSLAS